MKLPKPSEGGNADFGIPDEGPITACITHFCDIGRQKSVYQGEEKVRHEVVIVFELDSKRSDDQPFVLSKRLTLSMHEKSTMRKWLESIRGKKFTDADIDTFDTDMLIGVNCLVQVGHYTKADGGQGAKILSVMSLPKGMPKIVPSGQDEPKWITTARSESLDAMPPVAAGPATVGSDDDEPPF